MAEPRVDMTLESPNHSPLAAHSVAVADSIRRESSSGLLLATVLLAACYVIGIVSDDSDLFRWMNLLGPIFLGIAASCSGVHLIRRQPSALWTPEPWFLLATALYFGLGPLAYRFAGDSGPQSALVEWIMFRTNLLNAVGTLAVVVGILVGRSIVRRVSGRTLADYSAAPATNDSGCGLALLVFLTIGLPIRYLLVLPYEFGETDFTLPGSIASLANLVQLGLLIVAYKAGRYGGIWGIVFVCMLVVESVVSTIQFSKSAVVITLICSVLGIYLARPRLRILAIAAPIMIVVYVLITPIVSEGRSRIAKQNRDELFYQATLSERLEIGHDVITAPDQAHGGQEEHAWWGRLCYAIPQAFAMQLYDSGASGESFWLALYTFVPRVLWKEKPIITDVGIDFTELMTGRRGSSTGIGVYAEAYWNGGWLLVVVSGLYVGILLTCLGQVSLVAMHRSDWLLLPCVLAGIRMGLRIDGWFAEDFVGHIVIYAASFIVFGVLPKHLLSLREPAAQPA